MTNTVVQSQSKRSPPNRRPGSKWQEYCQENNPGDRFGGWKGGGGGYRRDRPSRLFLGS